MENKRVKLIAKDVWNDWNEAVENAKNSIVIFSPFISYRVIRLIDCEEIKNRKLNIEIITLFDIRNFLVHASSLKTIVSLLDSSYKVKHLNNLHAKVLIVDDEILVLGSQNFTVKGGKTNRETSAKITIEDTYSDNEFIKKLKEWQDNALEIPLSVAKHWLEKIEPFIKEITKLKEELILKGNDALKRIKDEEEMYEKAKNGTIEDCENYLERYPDGKYVDEVTELINEKRKALEDDIKQKKESERKEKERKSNKSLHNAKDKSRFRFKENDETSEVTIKRRPCHPWKAKLIKGESLTSWMDESDDEIKELVRLDQYPAFNMDTQVLRFIRLAGKQISICNWAIKTERKFKISSDIFILLSVDFNDINIQDSVWGCKTPDYNMIISLKHNNNIFIVKIFFDGVNAKIFGTPVQKESTNLKEFGISSLKILKKIIETQENLDKLVSHAIKHFSFDDGDKIGGEPPIATFLPSMTEYYVYIFTFENHPIFVFSSKEIQ